MKRVASSRKSWDTTVKHLARHGLLNEILTPQQIAAIPSSNISRWKHEPEDKYNLCQINAVIKEEIELIKRINKSSKIKCINQSYFKICDTFHAIIGEVKGIKSKINSQKDMVVNTIEEVKEFIPINDAIKIFGISRTTFENYKSIVVHECNSSYFEWCTKRFTNQLLSQEVRTIKKYMSSNTFKHWSKSSIYLKAVRDGNLKCSISTFYKYCQLLGFKNGLKKSKSDNYSPIITVKPNQIWCADVTIFKTKDHKKQYIHFLMDHYTKFILAYKVCSKPSPKAIKELLQEGIVKYQPEHFQLLTDGGGENVNRVVSNFIESTEISINHMIAQKDVIFSNSMIEALNKVIKHQFLYHYEIQNKLELNKILIPIVKQYNSERPQMSLEGNTLEESFNGVAINFSQYTIDFKKYQIERRQNNRTSTCVKCK